MCQGKYHWEIQAIMLAAPADNKNMGDFFSHSGYYKTGIYYVLHLICLSLTALSGKGNRN